MKTRKTSEQASSPIRASDSARPAASRRRWPHVLLALACGSALAWAWSALPPTLARGPYLQSASATGITVVFRTSSAAASTLRYGTHAGPPWEFVTSDASATTHTFALTQLTPGTRYFYEI